MVRSSEFYCKEIWKSEAVILLGVEAGVAIVAPLDNVLGDQEVKKAVVEEPCVSLFAHSVKLRLDYHI
jgi:hypothetical protein